jgi:hypothetical protein
MEVIGDVRPLILFLAGALPVALVMFFAIWANKDVEGGKPHVYKSEACVNCSKRHGGGWGFGLSSGDFDFYI